MTVPWHVATRVTQANIVIAEAVTAKLVKAVFIFIFVRVESQEFLQPCDLVSLVVCHQQGYRHTIHMAFASGSGRDLELILMVVYLESLHSLRPRSLAADFSRLLFLLKMFFDITMDQLCDHRDIAAAEREHSNCVEDWEAHRFVFGAVGDGWQVQELGSGPWRARLDQHVVAKVKLLQGFGERLKRCSQ